MNEFIHINTRILQNINVTEVMLIKKFSLVNTLNQEKTLVIHFLFFYDNENLHP